MTRIGHGTIPPTTIRARVRTVVESVARRAGLDITTTEFGHLFPELQKDPADRLPPGPATVLALKELGKRMTEADGPAAGDSPIPAVFTYFGQFLDHDITLDTGSATMRQLADPALLPLASLDGLTNDRSSTLDLDSIYGGPRDEVNPNKMKVGRVTPLGNPNPPTAPVPGKGPLNDLPRKPRDLNNPSEDRSALIGDPRNDENTIVAQLHTAFLKAHNTLVDKGLSFDAARKAMILRYQNVVLNDFLPRICDPQVVTAAVTGREKIHHDKNAEPFMPVEFAVAAYRFGHSMVRTAYDFNANFNTVGGIPATVDLLFTFTAMSGQLGFGNTPPAGSDTLPENWVIEWERIAEMGGQVPQPARAIDTRLTPMLFDLRNAFGNSASEEEVTPEAKDIAPMLATRNLLRGYLLGLPTGQAVARAMSLQPLTGANLIAALPTEAMKRAAEPFKNATPLWFYTLAEAGDPAGPAGKHLGPVGSRIVAQTLVNLIRRSPISILGADKDPALANFKLADLLELAAAQDAGQA